MISKEIPEGESEDMEIRMEDGISVRNMIHFCVAINPRPLKHHDLYCYLDLKVAIGELGLKVMHSKTAQVVLVDLTRKSPQELGSMPPESA